MSSIRKLPLAFVAFALLLAIIPFAVPNAYFLDIATKTWINAIVCVGLNLLVGYSGQISLGHAAFFALGGYSSAILGARYGVPAPIAMLAGAGFVALIALIIGHAILHLRGHYLAMATLGFGAIVAIVLNRELALTGGPDGMTVGPFTIAGYALPNALSGYVLAAIGLCIAVGTATALIDSRAGRALRAIKDSEVASETLGIDVATYKVKVFVVSAVFASVAGSIFAHADRFITPLEANFLRSVEFVAMVVVGGLGSVAGAVVGACILTLLPQALAHFEELRHVLTGAMLVGIMAFMPEGVVPMFASMWRNRKFLRFRREKAAYGTP
jgi:branched-chain amino acid transport system permease protein